MMQAKPRSWDLVGAVLSAVCLLHCILLPLLAGALPVLGAWQDEFWHRLLAALVLLTGLLAFVPGYRSHRHPGVPTLGVAGFGLLAAGLLFGELETVLTVSGSALLVIAHIVNVRLLHNCASHASVSA